MYSLKVKVFLVVFISFIMGWLAVPLLVLPSLVGYKICYYVVASILFVVVAVFMGKVGKRVYNESMDKL